MFQGSFRFIIASCLVGVLAACGGSSATLPSLNILDVTLTEGASASFTVSLSVASSDTVTVNFTTSPGSASEGDDYAMTMGVLTFAPGQTAQTLTVTTLGDANDEDDENFFVDLSSPQGATLADGQGMATLLDDDDPPAIAVLGIGRNEGNSASDTFTVPLEIQGATSERTISVDFQLSGVTATAGNDFDGTNGTATILPGSGVASIDIAVFGDTDLEFDEFLRVVLSNPQNAVLGNSDTAEIVLYNDDGPQETDLGPEFELNDFPELSNDGNVVVWQNDTPLQDDATDSFIFDGSTGITTLLGTPAGITTAPVCCTLRPRISADGQFVVYVSVNDDIVVGDTNNVFDAFLLDRVSGVVIRVSTTPTSVEGNGDTNSVDISDDGTAVAFSSRSTNLTPEPNATEQVYVKTLQSGAVELISQSDGGLIGNGFSVVQDISADGNFVLFTSSSGNLVAGDTNNVTDLFLRDRAVNQTIRLSEDGPGVLSGRMSSDANTIAFGTISGPSDAPLPFYFDRTTGQLTQIDPGVQGFSLPAAGFFGGPPTVSRNGQFLLFSVVSPFAFNLNFPPRTTLFRRDLFTGNTIEVAQLRDLVSDADEFVVASRGFVTDDGLTVVYSARTPGTTSFSSRVQLRGPFN